MPDRATSITATILAPPKAVPKGEAHGESHATHAGTLTRRRSAAQPWRASVAGPGNCRRRRLPVKHGFACRTAHSL